VYQEKINQLREAFEAVAQTHQSVEFWLARDLQGLLSYTNWQNFEKVISKAQIACETAGEAVADHFIEVDKMVQLGSGSERKVRDVMLTRYACYLLAQNGDPRKEEIAFAQSYFALQTRKQERIEERLRLNQRVAARKKLTHAEKELSQNIFERGVDQTGFARIRSKGDQALFGGASTRQMKEQLGVPARRPLADFLPTVTITAKQLATEITNLNVSLRDLYGEGVITEQHVSSNRTVREALLKEGIRPEDLPPEEDIKKLQRRVQREDQKLLKSEKEQWAPPDEETDKR
jgi:DNA-damage-inducible protein D